jgi:hypothetical protein
MKPIHKKTNIRIKLLDGQWYAFATGPKKVRNLLLVPAIDFCKGLNRGKKTA